MGITNPERDVVRSELADDRRHRPEENPFTYWERMLMIEAVLESEELDGRIVPFPISDPERLRQYVPARGTHYLRVFDEWGEKKVQRLQGLGYDVVVLEPGVEKTLSAREVRALMRDGGAWRDLVPAPVARTVERLRHEADRRPPS